MKNLNSEQERFREVRQIQNESQPQMCYFFYFRLIFIHGWLLYSIYSSSIPTKSCALRQGLNRVARKAGSAGAASCGGDLGSPRKAAGPTAAGRGLPVKARRPPQKNSLKRKGNPAKSS